MMISVRSMNIDDWRPTSGPIHTLRKISNGHNSATHYPIYSHTGAVLGKIIWGPGPSLFGRQQRAELLCPIVQC